MRYTTLNNNLQKIIPFTLNDSVLEVLIIKPWFLLLSEASTSVYSRVQNHPLGFMDSKDINEKLAL